MNVCDKYCSECGLSNIILTEDEWKQIDYLLSIINPASTSQVFSQRLRMSLFIYSLVYIISYLII